VVDASGNIYAVSYSFNPSKLYAISPDGILRWVKELSGESSGSPTVLASGDVVVSSLGTLSCFSIGGVLLWERTFDTTMLSGAVVGGSKNIFVGAAAGTSIPNARIYCVNRLGQDLWAFDLQGVEVVTPALDTRGRVYVGDEAGTVYSIDEDGLERWRWDAPGPIHAPVTVDSYSRLFFTCENASAASAVCLATIGTFLWQSDLPNVMHRSLRFADAGRLIAGSVDMVCLDGSGLEIWRIDQAGSLIITTQDGILTYDGVTTSLLALNFDGAELWRYALPRAAEAPPVLLRNGRALIFGRNPATMAGVLMALKAAPAPTP
jgi:outer membrane protein assembly factor BamB